MAGPLVIRDMTEDERAWAAARYREIRFAATPPGSVAMIAERGGVRVGLGRLVMHAPGVVELGGIWTDEAARGGGVARAMVGALLGRAEMAGVGSPSPASVPATAEVGSASKAADAEGSAPKAAGSAGLPRLWCIPFVHLAAFYESFGFAVAPPPWPPAIAGKVADCVALAQSVVVLAR